MEEPPAEGSTYIASRDAIRYVNIPCESRRCELTCESPQKKKSQHPRFGTLLLVQYLVLGRVVKRSPRDEQHPQVNRVSTVIRALQTKGEIPGTMGPRSLCPARNFAHAVTSAYLLLYLVRLLLCMVTSCLGMGKSP
jgi:hypothetical protein